MSGGYGRSEDGFGITRDSSVQLIVKTALDNGVTDPRQIAYILATAQHETRNFEAPEEDYGRSQANKLGYGGGEEYYGRGYVHLTHDHRYEALDNKLGLDGALVANPDLAKDPEIAAKILVIGMRDGLFTGRKLGRYINDETEDIYNARRTVNGISENQPWSIKAAEDCEKYAAQWEAKLPAIIEAVERDGVTLVPEMRDKSLADGVLKHGERGDAIETMQRQLNTLGYTGVNGQPLPTTGYFGDHTDFALRAFQRDREIEVDGKAGPETRRALIEAMNQHVGEARRPSGAEVEPVRTTTGLPWLDEAMSAMGRGDFDEAARIAADKSVTPAAEVAAKSAEAPTTTGIVTPEVTTTPLPPPLTIADPKHPQNFLYQQADKALGDQAAHLSPEERQRTVAAIAASSAENQFRKIDGVSMVTNNEGQRNWVATEQVVPRTPPFRAYAEAETARTQPVETSTQAVEKFAQEHAEQHHLAQTRQMAGPRV